MVSYEGISVNMADLGQSDRGEERDEGQWLEMMRHAETVSAIVEGQQFGGQEVPVPRDDGCEWGRKLVDLKGVAKPPEFTFEFRRSTEGNR